MINSVQVMEGAAARPGAGLLELDGATFRERFNRRPFLIGHRLAGHPLFELPSLIELARRLPEESVKYNSGAASVATGLYKAPGTGLSIEETLRRIEERNSWMVLKHVNRVPEYARLLDDCLDEVRRLSEPLTPGMYGREGFIFISSPRSVTPYHIDPEYNFLLQVRGAKTVHLFDPADREVLSERELEDFYASDETTNIIYRDEYEARAEVFDLTPGLGLHFPVTAPHWVENGDGVSVSFSITFTTPAAERRAALYRANARLRKMGLRPSPVGCSPFGDALKFQAGRVARRVARLARRF